MATTLASKSLLIMTAKTTKSAKNDCKLAQTLKNKDLDLPRN